MYILQKKYFKLLGPPKPSPHEHMSVLHFDKKFGCTAALTPHPFSDNVKNFVVFIRWFPNSKRPKYCKAPCSSHEISFKKSFLDKVFVPSDPNHKNHFQL